MACQKVNSRVRGVNGLASRTPILPSSSTGTLNGIYSPSRRIPSRTVSPLYSFVSSFVTVGASTFSAAPHDTTSSPWRRPAAAADSDITESIMNGTRRTYRSSYSRLRRISSNSSNGIVKSNSRPARNTVTRRASSVSSSLPRISFTSSISSPSMATTRSPSLNPMRSAASLNA